jgi:hypothetical protein
VPAPHDHGAPASGHHGAEVHAPAGHGAAPGESHHGPCTCVGTCAFGTTAPAAASRDAIRFAPIASALEVTATPYAAEDLPSAPSFLLPFSQGPPLSA